MGLAERRAANEFETTVLPGFKERIDEAAGFAVPLEINWDQLSPAGEARLFPECWPQVYFEPLTEGLKIVGRDKLGKEALAAGLKKVVIQNTFANYNSDNWAKFVDGVLILDHDPLTNAVYVNPRTEGLVKALEAGI